jgi:membrane-associated protease RseP (regulator of RpoE activity)
MSDSLSPISGTPVSSTAEFYRPMPVYVGEQRRRHYWLHILLFLVTIFTTLVVGARMESNFLHNQSVFSLADDTLPFFPVRWILADPSRLLMGVPFSATLMLILLAHEMGHYLCAEYYGVYATLPFFIPAPTLIGTLGAFIRIRSPIRSRSALFDIGIAGPIAGFLVAFAVLLLAMPHSRLVASVPDSDIQLGFPLIFRIAWTIHPLTKLSAGIALQRLYFHPAVIAAWVGMFATALNLLPGGQLDGGHIVFSITPRLHAWISRLTIIGLIPLAIYCWAGWIVWAVLLRISGMRHPMVSEWTGIGPRRRWLALFAVLMLIVTLTPAPFAHSSLLDVVRDIMGR